MILSGGLSPQLSNLPGRVVVEAVAIEQDDRLGVAAAAVHVFDVCVWLHFEPLIDFLFDCSHRVDRDDVLVPAGRRFLACLGMGLWQIDVARRLADHQFGDADDVLVAVVLGRLNIRDECRNSVPATSARVEAVDRLFVCTEWARLVATQVLRDLGREVVLCVCAADHGDYGQNQDGHDFLLSTNGYRDWKIYMKNRFLSIKST